MDHNRYQEQISQLIDNELPGKESPGLFAHLSTCSDCREFFSESMQLRSKLSSAPVPSSTTNVEHNPWSSSHIRRDQGRRSPLQLNSRRAVAKRQLPAIALMLFMFVVGGLLFSTKVEVLPPQENATAPIGISSPDNFFKR
jgi:predicted anti-sigma-YlaC factor YlaD